MVKNILYSNVLPSIQQEFKEREVETFRDLSFTFAIHPVTNDVIFVTNEEAIKNSVRNLILANRYDFLFDSSKFTDIKASLFENIDSGDLKLMKMRIDTVLRNHEPRVTFQDAVIDDDLDRNRFSITIFYTINNIQKLDEVRIFLERVR